MREIKFRAITSKYEVGSDGSVWSLDYNHSGKRRQLRQYLDQDGYPYVFLNHNGKRTKAVVHRYVAKAFLGERPSTKHQVNHKDSNRRNNDVTNLEWATSRENTLHGWVNGRKLSIKQIETMRRGTILYNHKRWHQGKECSCVL